MVDKPMVRIERVEFRFDELTQTSMRGPHAAFYFEVQTTNSVFSIPIRVDEPHQSRDILFAAAWEKLVELLRALEPEARHHAKKVIP